jgi:cell wall-associated NlpC family hydrolase
MDINKYVGIPYVLYGRDFSGCDCFGLVKLFYKTEFCLDIGDYIDYIKSVESYEDVINRSLPISGFSEVQEPQLGDVGLLKYRGHISHVAVYVGDRKILHVSERHNSIVQRISDRLLQNRFVGWYRYEER